LLSNKKSKLIWNLTSNNMKTKLLFLSFFLLLSNLVFTSTSVAPKKGSARSNYPRNAHHVVGGGGFAVELRNGEIWAWGDNTYGQLGIGNNIQQEIAVREFTNATNWADINPGQSHVLAVKVDGTLWAWGRNNFGQLGLDDTISRKTPHQIGFDNDWVTTGCGGNQSFAIKSNGTLWAWGNNSSGQLGIGTNSNSPLTSSPVQVGTASNWTDVAVGNNFTVALNSSGQMFTWGNNSFGQLGNGTSSAVFSPSLIIPNVSWTVVEAGEDYAMAIRSDGMLFAWGKNNNGQLGIGNFTNKQIPTMLESTTPWIGMSCGQAGNNSNQHSLGLKANGTAFSWGNNSTGALGNNQSSGNLNIPTAITPSVSNIIAVECGWGVSYIRDVSGQVFASGSDATGAVGNSQPSSNSNVFIPVSIVPIGWSSFSAGQNFTVALKSDGTLWFWGSNANGLLGNGSITPSQAVSATQIGINTTWKMVSAGTNHILAINAAGELYAWGNNSNGQIGIGTTGGNITTPTLVASTIPWISVSAGNLFSLGVKANGSLWSWGNNSSAQLGNGNVSNLISNRTPAQVGLDSNWVFTNAGNGSGAAVKANGTLWMWGDNNFGQLGKGNNSSGTQNYTPAQVTGGDWLCIGHTSGAIHVVALKSNGTLWSWGFNGTGALGLGNNNIIVANYSPQQIGSEQTWVLSAVGYDHSAAIKVNGTAWTWGDNTFGQLGLGYFGNIPAVYNPTQVININNQDTLDIVIDINCGWYHTGVIKEMREKICMTGQNLNGQIGDGTFGAPNNKNAFLCATYAPPCLNPEIPTINKFPNNNVCPGTNTTLSINTGNLNSAAEWRWYADACGTNYLGAGNSIMVNPNVTKTYFVRGETGACVTPGSCASITVNVNPVVIPSISISTSTTSICAGATASFTATPTNGGATPAYQWKVNGINVGTNSAAYSTSALTNGQAVTCVLTSNANCASPTTASSNSLTMSVTSGPTPTISISASNTTICAGVNVSFTASVSNGGASPAYQWKVNGVNAGINSNTFSTSTLTNGQVVTCVLTSNASCANPASVTSGGITITVNPAVTPSLNISTSTTTVCLNASTVFTATPSNGGSSPSYQWKVNGVNAGTNSATFTTATLTNGQIVTCVLTSNANCASPSAANSNAITMVVNNCSGVPTTQLTTTLCGIQNLALNAAIACTAVAGATNYDFEFTNLTTNAVGVKTVTSTSVSLSSVTPAMQFGTQYNVRVRAKVGGVYGSYGAVCVIGTVCNPTICGVPLTQLRSTDCGKLNLSPLTGLVIANAVVAASHYEFEIRNITTNAVYATKLQTSNSLVINTVTPALQWNTQYNVKVRAYIGGIAGTYGNNCVIGFIPDPAVSGVPNTQLNTASCGKLNLALTGSITCTAVTGAASYEWEFKNQANTAIVATKTTTSTSLNLSTVSGLQWNTQYNVRVRAYIGTVAGTYNVSCLIGLIPDPAISGVPSTKIRTSDCGKLNFGLGGFVVADPVSGAVEYEFEIRDNVTNAFIANKIQASNGLTFSTVPAFTWGMQYKISVRARISTTWGTFGTACTIGFICNPNVCGVPTTTLRSTDCGKLNLNFSTGLVVATTVNGATLYEFEITDLTTNAVIVQSRTTVNLVFNTVVPAMQNNRQYSIKVRATISGVVGTYGTACTIGFVSGSREDEATTISEVIGSENTFKLMAFPNPFNENITLYIQSNNTETVTIDIFDLTGKLVFNQQVNTNENILVGNDFANGEYIIRTSLANGTEHFERIIKVK
jgi:alpha-tubulin suppressor-like RCC1 family protein